jgi:hypothetical protein
MAGKDNKARDLKKDRRDLVDRLADNEVDWPTHPIGLAFSGGGIRSATLSLGITQALARRGRLYAFDYLSTVSGGGYFGVFLRSLFLPQEMRGGNPRTAYDPKDDRTFLLSDKILNDPPNAREFEMLNGGTAKHPIRWLRENGRYLAPSGSSDLFLGLSYIARNWLAMIYVLVLAFLAIFALLQMMLVGLAMLGPYLPLGEGAVAFSQPFSRMGLTLSPFFIPATIAAFVGIGAGAAYWLTEGMDYNPGDNEASWKTFILVIVITLVAGGIGYFLTTGIWFPVEDRQRELIEVGLLIGLIAVLTVAGTAAWFLIMLLQKSTSATVDVANPTPSMRRWLTKTQAFINRMALVFLSLALIDTLAIALRDGQFGVRLQDNPLGLFSLVGYPLAAYLIKKLPDWSGGLTGGILKRLTSNVDLMALIFGIFLFGSLAIIADAVVHMALWDGAAWGSAPFATGWWAFIIVVVVLGLMTGRSEDFINLSSLHPLYASRLTRAYIGASNDDRLFAGTELSDGHPKDHIDPVIYHDTTMPIAWHLVNLTLNVTQGSMEPNGQTSSIIQRDRKGQRFIIGPGGISVESDKPDFEWTSKAEKLSVGQQCAISGAAASSGMGRRTSLGTALALTYANVRLGYWWTSGLGKRQQIVTNWFIGTYRYLFDEITARYSKNSPRYYLTDGGHSENSGALALLERNCRFILVADNGQDPDFTFSDLEIFIRTARTDLGFDVKVANPKDVDARYGRAKKKAFLNSAANWREAARSDGGTGYALLMTAWKIDDPSKETTTIIWLKPRLFDALPSDIATYAEENKPFPHQTTVDQFFDEAQWESYRRLGYEMVRQLFDTPAQIRDVPFVTLKR